MRRIHMLGAWTCAMFALVVAGLSVVVAPPASAADTFQGNVEEIVSPAPGQVRVSGWMFDDDVPTVSITYHVYIGGGPGDPNAIGFNMGQAAIQRDDVARNYPYAGPFHGFSGTMNVPLRGVQPVYVFAINAGGPSPVNQLMGMGYVEIGNPPPDTTITSGPPATGTGTTASFTFTADEPSTFSCQWDEGAWAPCSSPATSTVGVGSHTFAVRATDAEGAVDPTPATWTFTVTAPPPPVVVPPPPPEQPRITLALKAVKKKSRLRIDVGPDLEQSNYRLKIQRKAGKKWRTAQLTQTLGPRDRIVIDLRRGKYRVIVPDQHDMVGTRATARLRR